MAGTVAEYNDKDLTFHILRNFIAHYMNDSGEASEFPWQEAGLTLNENLAFHAGLLWFSLFETRLRFTATDYTYPTAADMVVHSVARVKNHTQGFASDLWEIEHNFGTFAPAVFVFDEDNFAIDATVYHTDENNTAISFLSDVSGYAILLG